MKEFRYEVVVRCEGDFPSGYQPISTSSLIQATLNAARNWQSEGEDDAYVAVVGVDARRL